MKNILDVALIGGGIMSATLGTMLQEFEPEWKIGVIESQTDPATESSNAWNNAGTGHAALCELNYMPEGPAGRLSAEKAISINEQFQMSRQWWSKKVADGVLTNPETFINTMPHITFVNTPENISYLKRRYEILKSEPLFADMEYSEDPLEIADWAPLLIDRRDKSQRVAATRSAAGTDVNFGEITRQLLAKMIANGAVARYNTFVTKIERLGGVWQLTLKNKQGTCRETVRAKFVFVGAGGGALELLQSARIPEIKGYGGFPISGKFLRCTNPEVVKHHHAKVYGKAKVGAPPMSVPHLDTRIINGKQELLFGPYAGFSTNFLKYGSPLALFKSIRPHNIGTLLKVGLTQWHLEKYLLSELLADRDKQIATLRDYFPAADADDWEMITAGQRVQIMKKDPEKGAVLQFGTEIIVSEDRSIAGLLGASPGASVAVYAMLNVLKQCFPESFGKKWSRAINDAVPSYKLGLNYSAPVTAEAMRTTAEALGLES
ncbi:malate dehydrogenase (quinone) [Canibacter zhuwentaonis]|uniref:malate dehydrogenase (quinone) n=1 Tax=Canibacter zhuwentaonis TaxID=2837491 RepID=UPI00350FFBA7